jgi:hypothetical protein
MKKFTPAQVKAWRNGADGFLQWLTDIEPRVPSAKGTYEIFQPEPFQADAIHDALALKEDGTYQYITIALSFPRRHSKTTLAALLSLWRLCNFANENIVCIANTERQSVSVGFGLCKKIVLNTPFLLALIGKDNVLTYRIDLPKLQSSMRTMSCNISGLYGEKVTVGWCSEIHAAANDEAMQVLASSLGDSLNSWLLVDSTVDAVGGPLHRLEQLHETGEDPTVFVHRIEYRSLDEALEKSPPWISRDWLRSRQKQLLPAVFATQHLNQRSAASNNLFALTDIQRAQGRLPLPFTADDLINIAAGRTFATGGGLDRAYFGSLQGDATIWTSVAKIADATGGEPHFYVLNQKNILGSLGSGIKKAILADMEAYKLTNSVIEAYNAQDIATWAAEMQIPAEVFHATNTAQVPAFMELYRIVKEDRLHFSDKLKDLAREMETFLYELVNGQPRFGSDKWHDDRVYSLVWAVHSLRQKELAAYTLKNIVCESKSPHARLCYMRRGELILPCSEYCPSHKKVTAMYLQHRTTRVESDLTLPEFYKALVKVEGILLHGKR